MTNNIKHTLDGKVAVVTGAARNLGRSAAKALASMGATVVLHYHSDSSKESIVSLADEIAQINQQTSILQADLTQEVEATKLFDFTEEKYGKIDILVNTAGTMLKMPLANTSLNDYDTIFNVHTKAVFLLFRQAATRLNNDGRIINISTSLTAAPRGPGYSVYGAAKAAAEQLAKFLAEDVAEQGITVNTVSPGPVDNSFLRSVETEESLEFLKSLSVYNRLGNNEDITPIIEFLVSKNAHWVTGQNIRVNGGMN
jgi:NAD(P)-dependent dehydrogenase (short-subunit alcohol dehydrogenase family)